MSTIFSCILIVVLLADHEIAAKTGKTLPGKAAKQGQFPYYVYLFLPEDIVDLTGKVYGGTLIHQEWVLTAAHCFERTIALTLKNISSYDFVSMGALNMIDPHAKHNSIKKIVIHPNYENDNEGFEEVYKNDIALIKLSKKYELNNVVVLPWQSPSTRGRCKNGTIMGTRAKTWKSPSDLRDLRFATVQLTDSPPGEVTNHSPTYFYSKEVKNKEHLFVGDIGSAFVCYPIPKSKLAVQYGVISGIANNTNQKTIVIAYENIEKHMKFILKNIPDLKPLTNWRRIRPKQNYIKSDVRAGGSTFNCSYMISISVLVLILSILLK